MKRICALLFCFTLLTMLLWGCQGHMPQQNRGGVGLLVEKPPTQPPQDTTPTVAPTEAPTQPETTEAVSDHWKFAYIDTLQQLQPTHRTYALVDIDGDAIPELYASGDCEATGDGVYSYQNGKVVELRLSRTGGGRYVPGEGLLRNTNGNMGYYTTHIYKLDGGRFRLLWTGTEIQEYAEDENGIMRFTVTYHIDDAVVDQSNYYAVMGVFFPEDSALPLNQNALSYEEILEQLVP